jgi:hypothetical protein
MPMTEKGKLRKRGNRCKKRKLRHQLITQELAMKAQNNGEVITPTIGRYLNIGRDFNSYSIAKIKYEIRTGDIESARAILLDEIIKKRYKLNPKLKGE